MQKQVRRRALKQCHGYISGMQCYVDSLLLGYKGTPRITERIQSSKLSIPPVLLIFNLTLRPYLLVVYKGGQTTETH